MLDNFEALGPGAAYDGDDSGIGAGEFRRDGVREGREESGKGGEEAWEAGFGSRARGSVFLWQRSPAGAGGRHRWFGGWFENVL